MLTDELDKRTTAMNAQEVAEVLNVHAATVYKLAARQILPYFRVASAIRFDPHQLAAYLREHNMAAPVPIRPDRGGRTGR